MEKPDNHTTDSLAPQSVVRRPGCLDPACFSARDGCMRAARFAVSTLDVIYTEWPSSFRALIRATDRASA